MGNRPEVNLSEPSSDFGKRTNNDVSERRRVRGEAVHAHFSRRNTYKLRKWGTPCTIWKTNLTSSIVSPGSLTYILGRILGAISDKWAEWSKNKWFLRKEDKIQKLMDSIKCQTVGGNLRHNCHQGLRILGETVKKVSARLKWIIYELRAIYFS